MVPLSIPSVDVASIIKWNSFHPLSSAYRLYVDSGKYQLSLNSQICGWEISEMPFWVRGGRGVLLFKDQWLRQGSRESLCVPLLLRKKRKKISCTTCQHSFFVFKMSCRKILIFHPAAATEVQLWNSFTGQRRGSAKEADVKVSSYDSGHPVACLIRKGLQFQTR